MYLAGGVAAMSSFIAAHGGWRGDVDPDLYQDIVQGRWGGDTIYGGSIIFNRWQSSSEKDPLTFKIFVYVNTPAVVLALLLNKALTMVPPFSYHPFPLRITRATYYFVLFLICGFGQWFLIGTLIDKWRSRKERSR